MHSKIFPLLLATLLLMACDKQISAPATPASTSQLRNVTGNEAAAKQDVLPALSLISQTHNRTHDNKIGGFHLKLNLENFGRATTSRKDLLLALAVEVHNDQGTVVKSETKEQPLQNILKTPPMPKKDWPLDIFIPVRAGLKERVTIKLWLKHKTTGATLSQLTTFFDQQHTIEYRDRVWIDERYDHYSGWWLLAWVPFWFWWIFILFAILL